MNAPQHRAIRSFVQRAGRITPAQQRALATLWPRHGVEYSPRPLDLDALFGRSAPRILEVGFGDGDTLVELAVGFLKAGVSLLIRPRTEGRPLEQPGQVQEFLIRAHDRFFSARQQAGPEARSPLGE